MFAFLAASTVAASRPMRSAAATAVIDLSQPFAARPAIAGLLKLDVTSDEDVVAAACAAGNVNLLVNNAGIARAWATDNSHARHDFAAHERRKPMERGRPMIYQLRIYRCVPGQLPALLARFGRANDALQALRSDTGACVRRLDQGL